MTAKIKEEKIGKLRIYLKSGETVKGEKLIHKIFPENKYKRMLDEAKKSGILNAHIYHTHAASERGGEVAHHQAEGDNNGLMVCLELVDKKEKLELFFSKHKTMLKNKTVIYSEVEIWSFDE